MKVSKTPLAVLVPFLGMGNTLAVAQEDDSLSALFLEEVVVTAQKREESIQDVPVAVTALDSRLLKAQGINEPKDLKNVIPNFAVGDYQGETKITIRGVGQLVQASNPGVAVHIDGVYQPRASMAGLAQVDMAGVEVLRGPQGTTYGRNANGGAVNYSTTAPGEEFGGYVLGSVAEFNETRVQAALDMPISESVRTRLSVDRWERGEGYLENAGSGEDGLEGDTMLARFRVDVDFSESVYGSFSVTHAEVDGSFNVFDVIDDINPNTDIPGFNDPLVAAAPLVNGLNDPLAFAQNTTASQDREYQAIAGTLRWDINDTLSLKSITAMQSWEDSRVGDLDLTNADIVDSTTEEEGDTITQEFNLTFATDWASGVLGLFYLNDELDGTQTLIFRNSAVTGGPVPPGFIVPGQWAPYENESVAAFADMSFDLSDSLSLIAGVRFAQEEVNLDQAGGALAPAFPTDTEALGGFRPPGPPGVIVPYDACQEAFLTNTTFSHDSVDYDVVTPRLGLGYAASENNNLYATYSEGFKSGGFALRTGCGEEYDEETVSSFEIGSKNVLADGRVRLNATAFFYDYEGYQIEQLVGFGFELTNAEAAEVLGLELESTFLVNNNFSIIANASYQQSEFTDYTATDSLNPQLGAQDVSGNPLPGAPDATANISVIYEMDNGFVFQVNASYKSEINFREFDNDADAQEAYTLWNANIRWESEDDTINARLYANNLTDEEYVQAAFASSLTRNRLGTWGAPRQVGLEVSYNF